MQKAYNVSKILTPDHSFDLAKYKAYSPLFLAPTFALNYGLSFAALMAAVVHTALFNGKEIWYRFRAARQQEPDIHMKLMSKYTDAPDWWYGVLFVIAVALGLATTLGFPSQLPCKFCRTSWIQTCLTCLGWAFFISIILGLVFVVSSYRQTLPCPGLNIFRFPLA